MKEEEDRPESLRELAGEVEPENLDNDPELKKDRVIRLAIEKVDQDLTKIESFNDISQLPLTLINEVYRMSHIIEAIGTQEALKFASDSKRRLLDSMIKGKALTDTAPRSCEDCPLNEARNLRITEDRKNLDNLVTKLKLTKKQRKVLENHVGPTYKKYSPDRGTRNIP